MRIVLITLALVAGLGATVSGCAVPPERTDSWGGDRGSGSRITHRIPDGGRD
jgi:hypothetical protein